MSDHNPGAALCGTRRGGSFRRAGDAVDAAPQNACKRGRESLTVLPRQLIQVHPPDTLDAQQLSPAAVADGAFDSLGMPARNVADIMAVPAVATCGIERRESRQVDGARNRHTLAGTLVHDVPGLHCRLDFRRSLCCNTRQIVRHHASPVDFGVAGLYAS